MEQAVSVGFVKKGKEKLNTAQVAAWVRRSLVIFQFQAAKFDQDHQLLFCFAVSDFEGEVLARKRRAGKVLLWFAYYKPVSKINLTFPFLFTVVNEGQNETQSSGNKTYAPG